MYAYDRFLGDGATDYQMSGPDKGRFAQSVFAKCGYASTFVPQQEVQANRRMYLQTLMAYIDRGVPVIRYFCGWGVFVGYEEYAEHLLYLTADSAEPTRLTWEQLFTPNDRQGAEAEEPGNFMGCGWLFVGEKRESPDLAQLYCDAVLDMPRLLGVKTRRIASARRPFALGRKASRTAGLQA